MNSYQKIVRGDQLVQPGNIDTHEKFKQLTQGIDLKGKTLLDIGCNLGEMCRLAKNAGAKPVGIDIEKSYIDDAKKLNPDIHFFVRDGSRVFSKFDIVIASAMIHYLTDYQGFFERIAQIVNEVVVLDVWLHGYNESPVFYLTHRNSFIPNELAFEWITKRYFKVVEKKGQALSPDGSNRIIYHLREPIKKEPNAVLIYGEGNTGKSTMAKEMLGHEHLELDAIFVEWVIIKKNGTDMSVTRFVKRAISSPVLKKEYLDFHRNYLERWLAFRSGFNVVIEGYDMINKEYRDMVYECLKKFGWNKILEKELTHHYK